MSEEVQKVINALNDAEKQYPGIVVAELFTPIIDVLLNGAKKHGASNWLEPNGAKSSHTDMCNSSFHHLADMYSGFFVDADSGNPPEAHLSCRSMMHYVRRIRGLVHKDDFK